MRDGIVSVITFVTQVQSRSITESTADIVMGHILRICYRVDYNMRKYHPRPYDGGVGKFSAWSTEMPVLICPFRYFAAYFLAVAILFKVTQSKTFLLGCAYWAYDQNIVLHKWRLTRRWGDHLINMMMQLRKQPVCILTKTDEVRDSFAVHPNVT
jgi:hypothetical protein